MQQLYLRLQLWLVENHLDAKKILENIQHCAFLLNCKATKTPLPLNSPYDRMWIEVTKFIDKLHLKNHKQQSCKENLHPDNTIYTVHPDLKRTGNTQYAQQTFVYLARFKRIVNSMRKNSMPKCHHLFYLHGVIKSRNRYIAKCNVEKHHPNFPSVRQDNQ